MLKETVEYKRFVWELNNIINIKNKNNDIIFLCIGTNKVIGDSFGPSVGENLKKCMQTKKNIKVIGDYENIICYANIEKIIKKIKQSYKRSLIIVLDSALSNESDIGKIFIQNRGLKYAEGLGKKNNIIGNISIKAVVGKNCNNCIKNFKQLKNASIDKIKYMSSLVSSGIIEIVNNNI